MIVAHGGVPRTVGMSPATPLAPRKWRSADCFARLPQTAGGLHRQPSPSWLLMAPPFFFVRGPLTAPGFLSPRTGLERISPCPHYYVCRALFTQHVPEYLYATPKPPRFSGTGGNPPPRSPPSYSAPKLRKLNAPSGRLRPNSRICILPPSFFGAMKLARLK